MSNPRQDFGDEARMRMLEFISALAALNKTIRQQGLLVFLSILATVSMGVAIINVVYIRTEPLPVFAPLGDYPQQQVMNSANGVTPAVYVGDDILVTGRKCNNSPREVKVRGTTFITRIDPSLPRESYVIFTGTDEAIRHPGCEVFNWRNKMPKEVTAGTWFIEGTEVTVAGNPPQEKYFRTPPFPVFPKPQP